MKINSLLRISNPLINKAFAKRAAKRTEYPELFTKIYNTMINHISSCYKAGRPVILSHHPSPVEIIYSFDALPLITDPFISFLVSANLDGDLIRRAEMMGAPRDACSFQKSILGLWVNKVFPKIKAVAFSSINQCDSPKKVFEYLTSEVPGFFIDAPYSRDKSGMNYMINQLKDFIQFIEQVTGSEFNESRLNQEIDKTNACMKSLHELINTRRHELIPVKPSTLRTAYTCMMGYYGSPEKVNEFIKGLTRSIKTKQEAGIGEWKHRLGVLHIPPSYPNSINKFLGASNCTIVWDELPLLDYELAGQGLPGLAKKYVNSMCNKPIKERIRAVLKAAKDFKIDGFIHFSNIGCRNANATTEAVKKALSEEGVPMVEISNDGLDKDSAQRGQVMTRLESFVEML